MTNLDSLKTTQYFIFKAYQDGAAAALEMTNMKMQKLLFYAQSIHLALCDRPLFNEQIEVWRSGPVWGASHICKNIATLNWLSKIKKVEKNRTFCFLSTFTFSLLPFSPTLAFCLLPFA